MILAETIQETTSFLREIRSKYRSLGFVPTMGALHQGHLSLVSRCHSENDVTAVSIFVNPEQFNDPKDLENYPRNLERDLKMLQGTGYDLVFVPALKTIYPKPDLRTYDFGHLDKVMEGRYRPGHFTGVARVVSRLFQIIKPDRAYFGEKDFQQLAVIRKMTSMLKIPVEIRSCPTVRESDGLAMSSRNVLLNAEQRKDAGLIRQTLKHAAQNRDMKTGELKQWVIDTINSNPLFEVEYFEIVGSHDLEPVADHRNSNIEVTGCIAVKAGPVRLIDNIFFSNFAPL